MHECVKKLVDYTSVPDEAEIESLTKLLKTIGGNLDNTEKGKPMMDVYFNRIQGMIDIPDLPSRLQFMLMDIIDLRRKNWRSKEDNKGPKTLEEVRVEVSKFLVHHFIITYANIYNSLRLPLRKRQQRMLVLNVEAETRGCRWDVVIVETMETSSICRHRTTTATLLAWMTSVVFKAIGAIVKAPVQVYLVHRRCLPTEAAVDARWVVVL